MKVIPKVTEKYFGQPLGNGQDPDEPWDPVQRKKDGMMGGDSHMNGRGSQGGGSKPSNKGNKSGSAKLGSSIPKSPQRLRG